jgi:hypothetical protein
MKTPKTDEQISRWIRQAKATLAVEGLHLCERGEKLVRAKLKGELSHQEFLRLALETAKAGGSKPIG